MLYQQVHSIIDKVNKRDMLLLMRDMNAERGNSNYRMECVMGKESVGKMNENGAMLVDFCRKKYLIIGGSFFQHKEIYKIIWESLDKKTMNQIDHIMIKRSGVEHLRM